MRCLQCQHENPPGARFCNQCAAPFAPVCAACGRENAADARFCNQCGTALTTSTSAPGPAQAIQQEAEAEGRFQAALLAVTTLLQRDRRVTYRTLQYVFGLDDALMTEIGEELRLKRLAMDEEGKVLVWSDETSPSVQPGEIASSQPSMAAAVPISLASPDPPPQKMATDATTNESPVSPEETQVALSSDGQVATPQPVRHAPEAERRQLTVMFCDLVGSTDLSGRLDPEDLREVVRAYQEAAAEVVERYEGHIAQYLGDGLLIYFGFPAAHEDDAQRAVHTGLGLPEAMAKLNTRLEADYGVQLAVRIGIHTGPVVVGQMGGGGRHENLALGETPNIAARLEGLAPSNMAVISSSTAQLVQRSFVLEALGPHELKGVVNPMELYAVVTPRQVDHDDHEAMLAGGFDALVGRDEEIGILLRRWEQSKAGLGQVVLISGEAGIGKSRLVEGLRAHVGQEGYTRMAFRCSPYHTNSAFYPIIEHLQRALGWQSDDTSGTKLDKLEQALEQTQLAPKEAVPLLAGLLALPLPEGRYAALSLSPQQQRQQTHDVLVTWLVEEAERHAVLAVWEDLHWADPSTLEVLGLFVDQAPTAAMLHVLTFRPEFELPWATRSHLTPITLNRLEHSQVEVLIRRQAGDKTMPEAVVQYLVVKTDGVPLYVEELTKMLLLSKQLREEADQYVLTGPLGSLTIPDTLQDSLMARLDQANTAKEVAQLGAVLGREFTYEMLEAVATQDSETLQVSLAQLVEAELLYQRGRPPKARFFFKHALIRDAAYHSLLRSRRQQLHQNIAENLAARLAKTFDIPLELLAYHYEAAHLYEEAVQSWRRAGEVALEQSAYLEAIEHLRKGLSILGHLPDGQTRTEHEMALCLHLGRTLTATQGYASPEVEQAYRQAYELSQQVEQTPLLQQVLTGLRIFYYMNGQVRQAQQVAHQLFKLANMRQDHAMLRRAHAHLAVPAFILGNPSEARAHFDQGDTSQMQWFPIVLWQLGYPEQALRKMEEVLKENSEFLILQQAVRLYFASQLFQLRRDPELTKQVADQVIKLATAQAFPLQVALGRLVRGWALCQFGNYAEGLHQMQEGLAAYRATGARAWCSLYEAMLAEGYGQAGQPKQGLGCITSGLRAADACEERCWEAELQHLKGVLMQRSGASHHREVEACFHEALAVSRKQQAKSLELRAATSLARLWQSQDKRQAAYDLLAPVYEWFTEGFDTADLKDAKALLGALCE